MFSKALFKQSCKANGVMWAIITVAVCLMLACLMLVSGSGSITELKDGISSSMVKSSVESEMEARAINYYLISSDSLETFDDAFLSAYQQAEGQMESEQAQQVALVAGVTALNGYIQDYAQENEIAEGSVEMQELQGLVFYVININPVGFGTPETQADDNFNSFYEGFGVEAPTYDLAGILTMSAEERENYRARYAQTNDSIFLAGNMISESNIENIVTQLENFDITAEDYQNFTYTNDEGEEVSMFTGETGFVYINSLSNNTIVTFNARVEYEVGLGTDKEQAIQEITADLTGSFISTLPQNVSDSLMELGELDLYSITVGTIFFKMAGLLLPIIFIIMCSTNLIAGQVDSGSMAYVLSTSTKRKQVVFTQAMFLIGSILVMFLLTTVTSMICLAVLNSADVSMGYGDLLLLNLGAFITLFAMSGICFFASCWFNRSKHATSLGGGLNMFFLVATILGLFGSHVLPSVVRIDSLNFFNYVTIISLFDVESILAGATTFIWKWAILIAIGIVCYVVGAVKFKKKDLPL